MNSLPMGTAILAAIGFALVGLMIIASGQVFECLREIALNTRALAYKEAPPKSGDYFSLQILIQINHAIGILCIVFAVGIVLMSTKL